MTTRVPYSFQRDGASFMSKGRWRYLADAPGLGKTYQTIMAMDMANARNGVVYCPAVARDGWHEELQAFGQIDRRVTVIDQPGQAIPADGIVIVSRRGASIHRDTLANRRNDVAVIDEAHEYKSVNAACAADAYYVANRARQSWCLSGTPYPNNASEIWPFARACGATPLGQEAFIERYCVTGFRMFGGRAQTVITGSKNGAELRELLRPYMLIRGEDDVGIELPPLATGRVPLQPTEMELSRERFDAIRQLEQRYATTINEALEAGDGYFEGIAQLSTLRRAIGTAKSAAVARHVSAMMHGYDKAVVFAVHRDAIADLTTRLADFHPVHIVGGMPEPARKAARLAFQDRNSRHRLAICQIKAAGTALTLTAANYTAMAELSWSPADNLQAVKRIHRIGQTQACLAETFHVVGSIEERLNGVLARKLSGIRKLIQAN